MFQRWFRPNELQMHVFEQQFGEENHTLVYRRYGKGAAYRVSASERDALIAQYVADCCRQYFVLTAGMLLTLVVGPVGVMLVLGLDPDHPTFWWLLTPPIILLVAWFLWAGQRAVVRPDRELSRNVPIAAPLRPVEARLKALSQISYGMLAMAPLFGLLIVPLMAEYVDVWVGWGRIAWLAPVAFTALAAVQAYRKFEAERGRL